MGYTTTEGTRIAIQTMAEMQAQRVPNAAGPKLGGSALKQPNFHLEAQEWKAFILRGEECVINLQCARGRHNCHGKILVRETKPPLHRYIGRE